MPDDLKAHLDALQEAASQVKRETDRIAVLGPNRVELGDVLRVVGRLAEITAGFGSTAAELGIEVMELRVQVADTRRRLAEIHARPLE